MTTLSNLQYPAVLPITAMEIDQGYRMEGQSKSGRMLKFAE